MAQPRSLPSLGDGKRRQFRRRSPGWRHGKDHSEEKRRDRLLLPLSPGNEGGIGRRALRRGGSPAAARPCRAIILSEYFMYFRNTLFVLRNASKSGSLSPC